MRIMLSVDMEGLPDIFYTDASDAVRGGYFSESRKLMTRLAVSLSNALHSAGCQEIVIADAHGSMTNLIYSDMPEFVTLAKGGIKPLDMVPEVEGRIDGLAMLGFHAAAGTPYASFDHTYDGSSFHRVLVNGEAASEFYLCGMVMGERGIPVILVAGDDKLKEEVIRRAPWAEYIVLKHSTGYWSSYYTAVSNIEAQFTASAKNCISRLKNGKGRDAIMKPGRKPAEFRFEMKRSVYADVGELLPGTRRLDGYTLSYSAESISEGFRIMQLLSYASMGVQAAIAD